MESPTSAAEPVAGPAPPLAYVQGETKLPEFVLTPPEPHESPVFDTMGDSPDSAWHHKHRRGNSYSNSALEKPPPPLPAIPAHADPSEAQAAIAKITRMQRAQAPKHAWLKWSGLGAAREASSKLQARTSESAEDEEEQNLLRELNAECVATPPDAPASIAPEVSAGSRTPSLSPSATLSWSPTLSSTQTPPPGGAEAGPSRVAAPSSPEGLRQPRATYVPRELLSNQWNTSSSSSESEDEGLWSSEADSSDAESLAGQIPARLNLSHAEIMTNKQMRRKLRAIRKMRYGKYEQSESTLNPHTLRNHVAHGLTYASKAQRTHRAMERYTPAVPGDASDAEDKLLPSASVPDLNVPSRQSSPGIVDGQPSAAETKLPRVWKRRKRREWNNAPSAMDMAPNDEDEERMCPDVPFAQDAKPTVHGEASQAQLFPKGYKTELVYDMLHENQRGIVLFGVAKRFSSQVLFFWDPSPWTDASGANTALDITTMQLPDPTWEWVQPTWLVDMTCDTDEDGWQYSGSFTGLQVWKRPIHFSYSRGPNRWLRKLYLFAQRRSEKSEERHLRHEATRPDEGLVAMMRSARSRTLRWHGKPTMWTYVRRRRWVRLRRRLVPIESEEAPSERVPAQLALAPHSDASSDEDSSDEELDVDACGGEGAPRKVRELRHMHRVYTAKQQLHMLMPFFLMPTSHAQELLRTRDKVPVYKSEAWRRSFAMIIDQELRVQNPFVTLPTVQRWLARDDLAFVTSPLRARERRYQRRCRSARPYALPDVPRYEEAFDTCLPPRVDPAVALGASGPPSLMREVVVECNFTMAIDTMKLCRVDRLKLNLWFVWLGVRSTRELSAGGEREVGGPMAAVQHEWNRRAARVHATAQSPSVFSSMTERCLRARIHDYTLTTPHLLDVWDVLVAHLHEIMAMLDHERSRRAFLHLLQQLQTTDFQASTPAFPSEPGYDPRWRPWRAGVVRLPLLPAL